MGIVQVLQVIGLAISLLGTIILSVDKLGVNRVYNSSIRLRDAFWRHRDWVYIVFFGLAVLGFILSRAAYHSRMADFSNEYGTLLVLVLCAYCLGIVIPLWRVPQNLNRLRHRAMLKLGNRDSKILSNPKRHWHAVLRGVVGPLRSGKVLLRQTLHVTHVGLTELSPFAVIIGSTMRYFTSNQTSEQRSSLASLLAFALMLTAIITAIGLTTLSLAALRSLGGSPEMVVRNLSLWGFLLLGAAFALQLVAVLLS